VEFCARLSRKTGRIYRLPSEAEWEYACRAGTTTPYYFGETITKDLANYDNSYQQTTDVGKFPANPFGLFDMCGNIWEWCQDEWHDNYNQAPNDGSPWAGGVKSYTLLRGGSWNGNPEDCRSADRHWYSADNRNLNIGFRVVLVSA
jgi:formylglycine-generating enzyme required for sulfatase activity